MEHVILNADSGSSTEVMDTTNISDVKAPRFGDSQARPERLANKEPNALGLVHWID